MKKRKKLLRLNKKIKKSRTRVRLKKILLQRRKPRL